jgi:hypothetical protein
MDSSSRAQAMLPLEFMVLQKRLDVGGILLCYFTKEIVVSHIL